MREPDSAYPAWGLQSSPPPPVGAAGYAGVKAT